MKFGNSFKNDDFEDIRRYEEYQRRKDEALVKGVGNFLLRIIYYWFIFLASNVVIGLCLMYLIGLSQVVATIISIIASFFIFKIPYVKEHPIKSFLTLCFIFALESISFLNT